MPHQHGKVVPDSNAQWQLLAPFCSSFRVVFRFIDIVNRFPDFMIMYQSVHKFKYHEAIIMSTYYTAQYCLGRWALEKDGRSTTGKNKTE